MKKQNILKIIVLTLAMASQSVFAQDDRGSDKVDLKKLEDKYWSAKDDDYGVIQNRTFSKSGKFYGSLVYGTLVNDAYAESKVLGTMLGYYFTEDFGVEGTYLNYDSQKNENTTLIQYLKCSDYASVIVLVVMCLSIHSLPGALSLSFFLNYKLRS